MPSPQPPPGLANKRIILGVTGSIAAYKAPLLLRLLRAAGADVTVVMTASASQFVGAATFRGLGATTHEDMWSAERGELHIDLARSADAVVIAPVTADGLARLVHGRADDLLAATVLSTRAPLLLAPAMHPQMWAHPATRDNVATLRTRGARFVGPASGEVASGDVGEGRLAEPERIVEALEQLFEAPGVLSGKRVVVTAGPTRERIDPVRYLTNDSSGKMGFAIASAAARQGATVTLLSGPVGLATPPGVTRVDFESALQLEAALDEALGPNLDGADALIMAAAVADYRPATVHTEKLKRNVPGAGLDELSLLQNPDILAGIGRRRAAHRPLLVGFALETANDETLVTLARKKLVEKRVDLVVANRAAESLARDDNRVFLVSAQDCRPLPLQSKERVAEALVEWIATRLEASADDSSGGGFSGEFTA
ncbi:MAG TPA: bifunctional phosphopantothenoylcysteine decarboxylase/phosphopantothenate--cysteine ligase CoaBC [Polyangiaceae bacterium]|nr:bifunctional phosphopantothenoylcysteine decarboxylase/phosphopantothenate--cysteine ligase CoaBC [Polyangiaceae bacterium]